MMTSSDALFPHQPSTDGVFMRTTLTIEDDLLAKAERITGLTGRSALIREALKALIERESARRLALLGGSEPQLEPTPRRQSDPE